MKYRILINSFSVRLLNSFSVCDVDHEIEGREPSIVDAHDFACILSPDKANEL